MEATRNSGYATTYMGGVQLSYWIRRASNGEGRSASMESDDGAVLVLGTTTAHHNIGEELELLRWQVGMRERALGLGFLYRNIILIYGV